MGARNPVGIGLSYRPARLHRMAESIPMNLILGSLFKNTVSLLSSYPSLRPSQTVSTVQYIYGALPPLHFFPSCVLLVVLVSIKKP
jgi:hypothetical protein